MKPANKVVAMLAALLWLSVPAVVAAPREVLPESSPCVVPGEHSESVYLLVDRSDPLHDVAGFRQVVSAVVSYLHNDKTDMRLVLGVITGKAGEMRLIVDLVRPADSLLASVMALRKKRKAFDQCLTTATAQLEESAESYKTSAVLETLNFVADMMRGDAAAKRKLVIYSDMVQNSETLSLYGGGSKSSTDELIARVEKAGLRPAWGEAEVYVAGVGGSLSDAAARSVEQFWRAYFTKGGAALRHYGPVLTGF